MKKTLKIPLRHTVPDNENLSAKPVPGVKPVSKLRLNFETAAHGNSNNFVRTCHVLVSNVHNRKYKPYVLMKGQKKLEILNTLARNLVSMLRRPLFETAAH